MGEARRKRLAAINAYAEGLPVPRPTQCPGCGSKRIHVADVPPDKVRFMTCAEIGVCGDCGAAWEPFPALYVEDPVCAEPCDNCAFRSGSPEQQDKEKWKALLASLQPHPSGFGFTGRFFCHKNVPIDQGKGPGNFLFPKVPLNLPPEFPTAEPVMTEDASKMRTCSGFLRMVWAQDAKRRAKGNLATDPTDG